MSIQHLTAADYHTMPWKNGLGQTVEMLCHEDSKGQLLWRLSMATVTENGPFSLFPEVERNLTVLSGDGFDLVEDGSGAIHNADPLVPVAFSGDTKITADNVTEPCQDFNVMTGRGLTKPVVWVVKDTSPLKITEGGQLALFALAASTVQTTQGDFTLNSHELLLCQESVMLLEGHLICVALER